MMSMRDQYMSHEITHSDYYGALVEHIGETKLRRVLPGSRAPSKWRELIAEDQHLNNVPLSQWDDVSHYVRGLVARCDREALRAITGSGGWSLSDSTCVLKETARRYSVEDDPTTINIVRTVERTLPDRSLIVVKAEMRAGGPLSDGFSITADVWEARGDLSGATRRKENRGRGADIGGCMHEEIVKALPKLAPLVDVHLCALDGTPMHALANGWYFYSGGASSYERDYNPEGLSDRARAARALHIATEDVPEDIGSEEEFAVFVESLKPRWMEAADKARAVLEGLPS